MKILVLSNLFPPWFLGGYELLCGEVAAGLASRGHTIHVLTSNHGVSVPSQESTEGMTISRRLTLEVPFSEPYQFQPMRRAAVTLANRRVMREELRRFRPDIVFAWSQHRLTLGAITAATDSGVPVAWTFNDANILSYHDRLNGSVRGGVRWALSRWLLPANNLQALPFRHTTVISESLRAELVQGGLPVENASVIYQGIRLDQFPLRPDAGRIASPMRVCYVGQLHRYKGVHVAVSAVSRFVQRFGPRSISLTLVGDGPADYLAELRAAAAEVNADITFTPRVPREHVSGIHHQHDAFVFPSTWREPAGLTHLEAMASGLPVVSTTAGGQGEFLQPELNCLAFPVEDPNALCDQLDRLRREEGLSQRLAQSARKYVEEHFTMGRYLDDIEAFITRAAGVPT